MKITIEVQKGTSAVEGIIADLIAAAGCVALSWLERGGVAPVPPMAAAAPGRAVSLGEMLATIMFGMARARGTAAPAADGASASADIPPSAPGGVS